ncbi:glycoside hydrolase family 97 protein [Alistipes sp. An54]|uniref:glycoside hydrolase family 97 protein n=1 Tax=Alistipes sp. An54 TaxID=1965645 RepID=UPI001F14C08A|nr:glycoside hydrolase family 97 protein [Alistipes sp. An54]
MIKPAFLSFSGAVFPYHCLKESPAKKRSIKRLLLPLTTLLLLQPLTAREELTSPGNVLTLTFDVADGIPRYALSYKGRAAVLPGRLGFELKNAPALLDGFTLQSAGRSSFDETREPVWDETTTIRNHYNELAVTLEQQGRIMIVRFRLYDDGLGFRYEFPEQKRLTQSSAKSGPMDYTPGIFGMDLSTFAPGDTSKVNATTCNQLALYVTMYSPLQMAAEPGVYIVAARKTKGRNEWFVGGGGKKKNQRRGPDDGDRIRFSGTRPEYVATLYADAPDADYAENPEAYRIRSGRVTARSRLSVWMARGGGFAISLREVAPAARRLLKLK